MTIKWSYLGITPYDKALVLQNELRQQVLERGDGDYLLLLSHPPVVTRGVSERGDNAGLVEPRARFEAEGIQILDVDRGGKTTFHGPEQLTGYFIFDLRRRNLKLRQFVKKVAEVIVVVLDSYGIDGHYTESDPGIVIGRRKVGFLGFNVQHNVTTHGFSLNIGRDIKAFDYIVSCGKLGRDITSLEDEGGRHFSMYDAYWRFVTAIGIEFDDTLEEVFVDGRAMV